MSLTKEMRDDVEKIVNESRENTEKLIFLKFENLDSKLEMFNTNIINYINSQEMTKNDVQELKNQFLTRESLCPYKHEIKSASEYIKEVKAVKNFTIKVVVIAGVLITIINGILIYLI